MKLFVSAVLIFGLTWTRAEPSPAPGSEECTKLNSPLSLEDKTQVLGRFHFLLGYTDDELYRTLLGLTSSFWFTITETSTGLGFQQFNKMNGTCIESRANASINGNLAKVILHNISSEFVFVRSSRDSLILNIRASAANVHSFLQKLNLDSSQFPPELKARSFYLMGKGAVVSDSDLQQFRVYAQCAGFSGDPDYSHDPKNEYCSEEESILAIF